MGVCFVLMREWLETAGLFLRVSARGAGLNFTCEGGWGGSILLVKGGGGGSILLVEGEGRFLTNWAD